MIALNRLRWRCRRGMLELDITLSGFIETQYENLEPKQQRIFLDLLEYPDNELWDLISGKTQTEEIELNEVLKMLRQ